MSTLEEVQADLDEVNSAVTEISSSLGNLTSDVADIRKSVSETDTTLDQIAAFILTLKAGVVTQAQLDNLASKVASAKAGSAQAKADLDALATGPLTELKTAADAVAIEADKLDE